jgi:uncharacterized protein YkwD
VSRARPRRRLALGLALAALCACAAPGRRSADARGAAAPCPAAAAPDAPDAPGAGWYGDDPDVALDGIELEAARLVQARLARGATARISGALVAAARALARGAAEGVPEPIGPTARRAALVAARAHDPAPAAFLVVTSADRAPEALAEVAATAAAATGATHLGVGAAERDGSTLLVLLAADRKVRLDRFPSSVPPGGRATLSGTLRRGLRHPRVLATLPSGDVRELDVSGGGAFRAEVPFPLAGAYVVEVVAEGRGGPEIAALLAVSAGAAPTARVRAPRAEPARADAEAEVFRAVNALRASRELPPVAAAPDLTAVARRHSEAMREAGRIAHVLPGAGDLTERLRGAGIAFRRAYENVASAAGALAAYALTEESPAHRANLLQPRVTRVGIGVASGPAPSGGEAVFLTVILVEPPDAGADSPLRPATRVRQALWRERERAGAAPLTSDPALDALAAATAEDLRSRDTTDPGDLDARALALPRTLAAVDVFVASAPDDAVRSANVRDGRFRRVGVGVATGDSRRFGAGRLFIAVVYTD